MLMALVTVGSISALGGALVATLSGHWPQRQTMVGECGGGLFLLGVTLIACCFPQM